MENVGSELAMTSQQKTVKNDIILCAFLIIPIVSHILSYDLVLIFTWCSSFFLKLLSFALLGQYLFNKIHFWIVFWFGSVKQKYDSHLKVIYLT